MMGWRRSSPARCATPKVASITSTPVGPANPQSWNGYAYVGNNPLNITDPNGESWITALFGVFGFIGGALSGGALFPWWYTAIMTGATTAGAQYSVEKAVESGNIAASAGMFIGGPPTFPDYNGLGGRINGGVYGSGSQGPFIFSIIRVRQAGTQRMELGGPPPSPFVYDVGAWFSASTFLRAWHAANH